MLQAIATHFAQAGGRADFIDPSAIPPGAALDGVDAVLLFVALLAVLWFHGRCSKEQD